jgi:DNA helicase II / ATP-dependent DNA helicase PcrA
VIDINALPDIGTLHNIDARFKVFAGPGAGKTTWLVEHVQKILKQSSRLGLTGKVACITYTNVAAEQLMNRMRFDKSRVEVTTIHSFLYNHIIKPFSFLIKTDSNGEPLFNIYNMQGHEGHFPHADKIRSWVYTIEQSNRKNYKYLSNKDNIKDLIKYLSNLDYKLSPSGQIQLATKRYADLAVPTSGGELWIYKKKYWSEGILHHEDVLYFAWLIIQNSPRVLDFVRSKFPYVFIDEFQDTTTLQTVIIRKIAEGDTTIGVIGDLAQSIYKFAGAVKSDFENLNLVGMNAYKLDRNYRSTQAIIDYLNDLRTDISQRGYEKTEAGSPVTILIGSSNACYNWVFENVHPSTIAIAKDHTDVSAIKSALKVPSKDLIALLYAEDTSYPRVKFIHSLLLASKWLEKKNPKEALRIFTRQIKLLNPKAGNLFLRKIAIDILEALKKDENKAKSAFSYYMELVGLLDLNHLKAPPKLAKGNAKDFYEANTMEQLLANVKVDTQSDDRVRTIHSTKGAEYDNVLVCIPSISEFEKYVFDAKARLQADSDDGRVYYVAFSRAMKNLYINIPNHTDELLKKLEPLKLKYNFIK